MTSDGSKLLFYDQGNQLIIYMGYAFLVVSFLAVAILVFGSWFHKMVGVEIIHTLQIIYYLQFTIHNYTEE
jgi:hypothetical protein